MKVASNNFAHWLLQLAAMEFEPTAALKIGRNCVGGTNEVTTKKV